MIEFLPTRPIAFLIRNTFWVSGGAEARYKQYLCKGLCKGKSYETICENIVFRYQSLVSSLPGPFFCTDNRKPNYNGRALKGATQ